VGYFKIILVSLFFCFNVHATNLEEAVVSPNTFVVCKAADVLSTMYIINSGIGVESNPVVAASIHIGRYIPLILISVVIYKWIKDNPQEKVAIGTVNAVTCGVALQNILLIP